MIPEGIVRKIQALAAKTIAAGCTEAEASAALNMVAQLMAQYGVQEEDLRGSATRSDFVTKTYYTFGHENEPITSVLWAMGLVTEVKVYTSKTYADPLDLGFNSPCTAYNFFGFRWDVEIAFSLAELVRAAYATAMEVKPKGTHTASFRQGVLDAFYDKLQAMRKVTAQGKSSALVLRKKEVVDQALLDSGVELRAVVTKPLKINSDDFAKGYATGAKAEFAKGLGEDKRRLTQGA
jgi:hypothetical protein